MGFANQSAVVFFQHTSLAVSVRAKPANCRSAAKNADDSTTRFVVIVERPLNDLVEIKQLLLVCQEGVTPRAG